jgi:hypothetical protein
MKRLRRFKHRKPLPGLGIRDAAQLADHRMIQLLATLVEAQARPRSLSHQIRYMKRLQKWRALPVGMRADCLRRHDMGRSLIVSDEFAAPWCVDG